MITNPLSYTSNCHESLAYALKQTLKKMGIQEHYSDYSSTLAISLDNNIVLNIGIIHDRLWLWSPLNISDDFLYREPARIFAVLTTPVHRVETGQFVLGKKSECYELKALIDVKTLKNGELPELLCDFYQAMLSLSQGY